MNAMILYDENLTTSLITFREVIYSLELMPGEALDSSWVAPLIRRTMNKIEDCLKKYDSKTACAENKKIFCLYVERGSNRLENVTKNLATMNATFFVKDDNMELDDAVPYKIMAKLSENEKIFLEKDTNIFRIEG